MRILVVVDAIWPPAVDMAGMSIIYKLQKILNKHIETHILTLIEKWTDSSWKAWFKNEENEEKIHFYYIDFCILKKLPKFIWKTFYYPAIMVLNSKYHFNIIHFYSTSPIILKITALFKQIVKTHVIVSLCCYVKRSYGYRFSHKINALDKIICSTRRIKMKLELTGVPKNKAIYLPLGVDSERFNLNLDPRLLRDKLNIPPKNFVILYLGPLEKEKGIFVLAKAIPLVLKIHPNTIFIVAATFKGSFFRNSTLREYINNRNRFFKLIEGNKEKVRFLEGQQDVPLLMALADIFVLPLTTHYRTLGHPLTLLEAMESGKSIVASNSIGVDEVVIHGRNGLLFPRGNNKKLVQAINILLSDEKLRKTLAKNAKHDVEEYNVSKVAQKLIKIYKDVIKRE